MKKKAVGRGEGRFISVDTLESVIHGARIEYYSNP